MSSSGETNTGSDAANRGGGRGDASGGGVKGGTGGSGGGGGSGGSGGGDDGRDANSGGSGGDANSGNGGGDSKRDAALVVSDRVLDELVRRCDAGEAVALCTVVAARGSTPQAAGARMLLLGDGQTIGTLGGGCVEAEVRQQAIKLLHGGISQLLTFKLDHDYGWDDGLICGGSMDIFVETLSRAGDAEKYKTARDALRRGEPANISIAYDVEGERKAFRETLDPPGKLLIVGAGHVGQALAALATSLQFHVSVLDDRADCASAERFPSAARYVADIEASLRAWPIDAQTYVVIVTRGHRHDGRALAAMIDSPAKYLGLIGSKRKVKTIFEDLLAQGAPLEKLLKVHAPIGLEIGAVTVPEIAVSIAAELVAVRRGRGGAAAMPLKFDAGKLRELLEVPRRQG